MKGQIECQTRNPYRMPEKNVRNLRQHLLHIFPARTCVTLEITRSIYVLMNVNIYIYLYPQGSVFFVSLTVFLPLCLRGSEISKGQNVFFVCFWQSNIYSASMNDVQTIPRRDLSWILWMAIHNSQKNVFINSMNGMFHPFLSKGPFMIEFYIDPTTHKRWLS